MAVDSGRATIRTATQQRESPQRSRAGRKVRLGSPRQPQEGAADRDKQKHSQDTAAEK
jgi:hypothetical protein